MKADSPFSGHSVPLPYSGPILQVLSSSVTTDFTNVQLKCSGCTSWSGGSLDVLSISAEFMYASAPTGPSDPSNPTSSFPQHNDYGTFNLDLTSAYVSSSASTNIASTSTGTSTSTATSTVDIGSQGIGTNTGTSAGNGPDGGVIIPPIVNTTRPNPPHSEEGTNIRQIVHSSYMGWRLIVDYHRTWNNCGARIFDIVSPWSGYNPISQHRCFSGSCQTSIHSNLRLYTCTSGGGTRILSLSRKPLLQFP